MKNLKYFTKDNLRYDKKIFDNANLFIVFCIVFIGFL